jgi:hypothetical protein
MKPHTFHECCRAFDLQLRLRTKILGCHLLLKKTFIHYATSSLEFAPSITSDACLPDPGGPQALAKPEIPAAERAAPKA